jgi:hypothetical protein
LLSKPAGLKKDTPKSGSFTLNLRVYWPKAEMLDGSWLLPPVKSFVAAERVAITDGVAIDRIWREELALVVHRERPEGVRRRQLPSCAV